MLIQVKVIFIDQSIFFVVVVEVLENGIFKFFQSSNVVFDVVLELVVGYLKSGLDLIV